MHRSDFVDGSRQFAEHDKQWGTVVRLHGTNNIDLKILGAKLRGTARSLGTWPTSSGALDFRVDFSANQVR